MIYNKLLQKIYELYGICYKMPDTITMDKRTAEVLAREFNLIGDIPETLAGIKIQITNDNTNHLSVGYSINTKEKAMDNDTLISIKEVYRLKNIMDNNLAAEINTFQRKTGLVVASLDLEEISAMGSFKDMPVLLTSTIKL